MNQPDLPRVGRVDAVDQDVGPLAPLAQTQQEPVQYRFAQRPRRTAVPDYTPAGVERPVHRGPDLETSPPAWQRIRRKLGKTSLPRLAHPDRIDRAQEFGQLAHPTPSFFSVPTISSRVFLVYFFLSATFFKSGVFTSTSTCGFRRG